MTMDIDALIARMNHSLAAAVGADLPLVRGYAEAKTRAVAHYADTIALAYAEGALSDEELRLEIEEIEHMTRRFARNLKGLAGASAERAARAALGVVFGAVRGALAFAGSPIPALLAARYERS